MDKFDLATSGAVGFSASTAFPVSTFANIKSFDRPQRASLIKIAHFPGKFSGPDNPAGAIFRRCPSGNMTHDFDIVRTPPQRRAPGKRCRAGVLDSRLRGNDD